MSKVVIEPNPSGTGTFTISAPNSNENSIFELPTPNGGLKLPVGTTAQRPGNNAGIIRYNTTTGVAEYNDGGNWKSIGFVPIAATGGTITETTINGIPHKVHTFSYTGSNQTFSVSGFGTEGIITAYLWGAAGGGANAEGFSDPGGPGGFSTGKINLNGRSILVVQVGQGGTQGSTSRPATRPYPNGGFMSLRSSYTSGAGGGRSAIFSSSVTTGNALMIAGGGGGASGHGGGSGFSTRSGSGGGGGGTAGGTGQSTYQAVIANGASQTAAGTTSGGSGRNPGQLAGADAGNGTAFSAGWNAAGGGGDGWWGGGAIDANHQGGGGGSGYLAGEIFLGSLESTTVGVTRVTTLNPPQTSNQFYQTGIGRGNNNAVGGNGLVIIAYPLIQG